MSVDKLVDSTQLDADLTSVANAIRSKGGTSASLAFPSGFVTAISAISGGLNIKKFTATLSADSTSNLILITDDYFKTVRNDPNGFVLMRYLGAGASTAEMVFWFGSNMTIAYGGTTAYNMLAVRQTTSNAVGIYNTRGLVGDNYSGHINITANGGLRFINSASYPMKAGTYEILAGIWD